MTIADTTTYRVETIYEIRDKTTPALKEIEQSAVRTSKATSDLNGLIAGLGIGAAAFAGLHAGKKFFVDFNSEMETAKISLSTVTAMNLAVPFDRARVATDKLYERFQALAAQSPATTKDFVNMANSISGGVLAAGLGLQGLERVTAGAITASTALGAPAEMLALDITQMLAGTVGIRDRYARQLLSGIGEKDYHKFNKYDATKRAELVAKTFDQSSLADASKSFETSFKGVTSTLEDNIEIKLGKVGLPLFRAVTAEVQRWNDWMTLNKTKLDEIGKSVSDGLIDGFKYAKSSASFLIDNAGPLMEIGKVWAMVKLGGALGGSITNGIGAISGLATGAGGQLSGIEKSFNRMAQKMAVSTTLATGMPGLGSVVGAGVNNIGGLFGAAGSIGIGGALQIGLVSHTLGEYLGVHREITKLLDPQRVKYAALVESMKRWDDALGASRDRLAGRTGTTGASNYANAVGAADMAKLQAEAMKDSMRMLAAGGGGLTGGAAAEGVAAQKLRQVGMDNDEIKRFISGGAAGQMAMVARSIQRGIEVQGRADLAAQVSQKRINEVMSTLTPAQKQAIDVGKGTQRVMELAISMLAGGKGTIDFPTVRALLLGADAGNLIGNQTKPPVTNIKIDRVEVAAKDPDRWIAELDAKARSHVTAPREPRGSVRRGGH